MTFKKRSGADADLTGNKLTEDDLTEENNSSSNRSSFLQRYMLGRYHYVISTLNGMAPEIRLYNSKDLTYFTLNENDLKILIQYQDSIFEEEILLSTSQTNFILKCIPDLKTKGFQFISEETLIAGEGSSQKVRTFRTTFKLNDSQGHKFISHFPNFEQQIEFIKEHEDVISTAYKRVLALLEEQNILQEGDNNYENFFERMKMVQLILPVNSLIKFCKNRHENVQLPYFQLFNVIKAQYSYLFQLLNKNKA